MNRTSTAPLPSSSRAVDPSRSSRLGSDDLPTKLTYMGTELDIATL